MPFGFVLVGGRSTRMGRDKALLPYRGVPMAFHQAEKLAFVCGRAALVGKDRAAFAGSPYPFVEDGAEPTGVAYGLLAALDFSPEETNLVLAADMPRVPTAFLAALLELSENVPAPALVPVSGGHPQVLCAVWRRGALGPLRSLVAEGELSLRALLARAGGILLSEKETAALPGGGPESFRNVNTPEEYEALEEDAAPLAP